MPTSSLRYVIAIMVGALFIGVSGVLYKLSGVEPATGVFWRMVFALPLSFIWMQSESKNEKIAIHNWLFVALSGVAFAADMVSFHMSLGFTFVGNATTLTTLAPLLVVFFALFIGEKPTLPLLIALALAISGALLIMTAKNGFQFSQDMTGSLYALASAVFFALYIVFTRVARRNNKTGAFNFTSTSITAVSSLVVALLLGETILPQSLQSWGYLIALGILSHGLGQGLTAFGLGKVPAGIASVVMSINAPISVIVGAFVLNQIPLQQQIWGCGLIIVALLLIRPK